MKTTTQAFQLEKTRLAPSVALGFFIVGLLSLAATLAILLIHPQIAFGDPYRLEFLAFAALTCFGFIGSFAFGSAYVIAPVMGGSSLFNDRLTFYHLMLHGGGLACLILVFGGMNFLDQPEIGLSVGIGIILLGAGVHIINLLATASRRNRWEPEQITLIAALFWLSLLGVLGAAVLVHHFRPFLERDPLMLLESHATLGLVGFLWLGLMGGCLKLFNMFLVTDKAPGTLSWIGWTMTNFALMVFVPLQLGSAPDLLLSIAIGLLLLGSLFYLADIVRIWLGARAPYDWALSGAFAGLISGLLLVLWVFLGSPLMGAEEPVFNELGRVLFLLGAFGTFATVIVGLGMHLVPFLVWQIRCAPQVGRREVPAPKALESTGCPSAVVICLTTAWPYLALSQWADSPVGTQLAALCMAVGLFWFIRSLMPAFRVFVYGISLDD